MQLGQAQIVRSNWYDRARLFVNGMYSGSPGPHADTNRLDYTVPANRVARVTLSPINLMRTNAPSVNNLVNVRYWFTPSGESEVLLASHIVFDASTYVRWVIHVSGNMLIEAGDRLRFSSYDLSTGGAVSYNFGCSIIEYDA